MMQPALAPGMAVADGRQWLGASVVAVCLLGTPAVASAGSFTPPVGVTDYRLAFVTDTTTDATSTAISTYNSLVATEALDNSSLPSTTWTAIASTATVSAATNISCGTPCNGDVPIFLVDGTEVATSTNALFAGSILNLINEDESGVSNSNYVWTGSNANGTIASGAQLGSADPVFGAGLFGTSDMIDFSTEINTDQNSLYAISGEIAVVPEPASLSLLAFGSIAMGLARKLRRGRRPTH